jgi:hypothetical protein
MRQQSRMRSTPGIVVAVNRDRLLSVVRVENERHAVVGYEDHELLEVGDVLTGDFGASGPARLLNLTTGENLLVRTLVVDSSFGVASVLAL